MRGAALSALGMVTSVGRTVESASSAIRAGIARPRALLDHPVLSDDFGEDFIVGHPIYGYTEGFTSFGLWVRLAAGCLADLRRNVDAVAEDGQRVWDRSGIVIAVPVLDEDRFLLPAEGVDRLIEAGYVQPLLESSGFTVNTQHQRYVEAGHIGATKALSIASAMLDEETLDQVLVVAADSYIGHDSLDFLASREALKTSENPHGAMPGEAAACFALESAEGARRRRQRIGAVVEAASYLDSDENDAVDPAVVGRRLSDVVRTVLGGRRGKDRFAGEIYLDLNGEKWRSSTWGHAMTLLHEVVDFGRCREVLPAISLGDVGAASGAVAVCLAVRSFQRQYALTGSSLICSVSDSGAVAAALLSRA